MQNLSYKKTSDDQRGLECRYCVCRHFRVIYIIVPPGAAVLCVVTSVEIAEIA